jgi:hypothetical protein
MANYHYDIHKCITIGRGKSVFAEFGKKWENRLKYFVEKWRNVRGY